MGLPRVSGCTLRHATRHGHFLLLHCLRCVVFLYGSRPCLPAALAPRVPHAMPRAPTRTPLRILAWLTQTSASCCPGFLRARYAQGADPHATNATGATPLHAAARAGASNASGGGGGGCTAHDTCRMLVLEAAAQLNVRGLAVAAARQATVSSMYSTQRSKQMDMKSHEP